MVNQASVTPAHGLRTSGLLLVLLAGSTVTGCSGFASMQDLHYSWTNKHRASSAWLCQTTSAQRRDLGNDYAKGFKQGFYDASTGRGCKTPAVPPPCYWSTKYQCCEGQKCIQDWFCGYQCGVVASEGKGFPSFHDVPVGPCAPTINSSGCQGCYSPAYCECGGCGNLGCTNGQCSPGVHADRPDSGDAIHTPFMEYGAQQNVAPSGDTQVDFTPVRTPPQFSLGAVATDEGYVTHTTFQTSYAELFTPENSIPEATTK